MSTLRAYLITGLAMAVVGVGGLMLLFTNAYPTLGPRWLFFFLLTLGVCGIALPAVAYLHRRFPSDPPVDWDTILREAIWFGTYFSLIAWLQLGRVLNLSIAFFLLLGFVLIEYLIRMRERSRWEPRK